MSPILRWQKWRRRAATHLLLSLILAYAPQPSTLAAEQENLDLLSALRRKGFENLAIHDDRLVRTVWYENRVLFSEPAALGSALLELALRSEPDQRIRVIAEKEGRPVLSAQAQAFDVMAWHQGALSSETFAKRVSVAWEDRLPPTREEASFGKLDLQVMPSLRVSNTLQASLQGDLQTTLSSGLSSRIRVARQFDNGNIQLGYGGMSFFQQVFPGLFSTTSLGYYGDDGWGAAGQLSYFLGPIVLDLGVGDLFNPPLRPISPTSSALYGFPQAVIDAQLRLHPLDLILSGGYGSYLYGDKGPFVKLKRWFDWSSVEFMLSRTELGTQLRMSIGLNLWPGPKPSPSGLRVYGPGWYSSEFRLMAPRGSDELWPQTTTDETLGRLTPEYLRSHLEQWEVSPAATTSEH